jgi:hypothetical protein
MRGYGVGDYRLAQAYAALIGIVLVVIGAVGFIANPIVGEPSTDPLFVTGAAHDIVHLVTGALALYIAFGLTGEAHANGVIGFGILYAVIFLLLLVSPKLLGILEYEANAGDQVLHGALAVVSLAVGYVARGSAPSLVAR